MDYRELLRNLFVKAKDVREKQKSFFKTRNASVLRNAKKAEQDLDEYLEYLDGQGIHTPPSLQQPLF